MEIYPSVVDNRVTAYFKRAEFRRVQLVDQGGRILEVVDITNQQADVSLNLVRYASGIYYLKFIGNEQTITSGSLNDNHCKQKLITIHLLSYGQSKKGFHQAIRNTRRSIFLSGAVEQS